MKIKVTLDVFSGRPNPEWIVESVPDWRKLPASGPVEFPANLGYRGITLMNMDPSDSWTDARIYREYIEVKSRNRTNYYFDVDRGVENAIFAARIEAEKEIKAESRFLGRFLESLINRALIDT